MISEGQFSVGLSVSFLTLPVVLRDSATGFTLGHS